LICHRQLVDHQITGGLSWVRAVAHKCRDRYSGVGTHIRVEVDLEAVIRVVVARELIAIKLIAPDIGIAGATFGVGALPN